MNFIGGEWVAGATVAVNSNPSNTSDVVGKFAEADAAQTRRRDRRREEARSRPGRRLDPGAREHPRQGRRRDPRAQGRARQAAVARGRQDPSRRHRRNRPRRAHLQVLRRRSAAPPRREAGIRAARRRSRDLPRAARRDRTDHAVELPDRDSGLEDRARRWRSATPSCCKPANLAPGCAWAIAEILSRAGLPPGVFNLIDGARLRRRRGPRPSIPDVNGAELHRQRRHRVARSRPRPSRAWRACSSRWAARIRWSCWTMPTCDRAVQIAPWTARYFATGQRCTASPRLRARRHPRQVRRRRGRTRQGAEGRRCADRRHADGPGRRPTASSPIDLKYVDIAMKRRRPYAGRAAASALKLRDRRLLHVARALIVDTKTDAHQRRRKSSARSPRVVRARTTTRRWRSPTTPSSACPPAS